MKIEKDLLSGVFTVRMIGRFQSAHVEELKKQVQAGPRLVLDLKQVTIVDVDVVRFLVTSEADGVRIVHCPRYIREWMRREGFSHDHR